MDNKEKISVELDLVINKFNNKLKQATSKMREFGQSIKNKISLDPEKKTEQALTTWLTKLTELDKKMEEATSPADVAKLLIEYKKLENEMDDASEKTNNFGDKIRKNFKNGINSVKKFAFALFNIRNIWMIVSRASSSYISENIDLSNKLRAVWIGLGSLFAPIIEFIANGLLKIVMYLNAFIKGLFKVDLLANAIAKSTAKTAKSAKEASKSLAGFDEINNIDTSSDSGNSEPGWASAFDNVDVNTKWMEKLQKFGEKIRDIWGEIVKHWKTVLIIVGVVGGIILAFKLLSKSSLTAGTSLLGLAVTLGGLALIFMSLADLIKEINAGNTTMKDIIDLLLVSFTAVAGLMAVVALLGPSMTAGMLPFSVVMAGIVALLFTLKATLPTILGAVSDFITSTAPALVDILNTIFDGIDKIINALGKTLPPIIDSIGKSFERVFSGITRIVDSVFNGVSKVIDTIGNTIVKILNTISGTINEVLNGILNFINKLGPAINNFVDNCIAAVTKLINFMISGIEYLINTLIIGGINKLIKAINSLGKYVGFTIPSVDNLYIQRFVPRYDVGTNYVPNDQLAMVHKGEAIVPKKFNNQEFFGIGNEEILAKLDLVVEAINDKDFNTYLDGKTIGKTAQNYINNQSRIMGRSVI